MTITQLEYVVAVATYRSFILAAEKCFVTQPTLSMQIQKLEDEFGVKLFDRNKHPIEVTPFGTKIVAQAKIILSECERVNDIISKEQNRLFGIFKLGVIPTVAPYIIPTLLEKYQNKYPDIKLKVKEMETNQIITALRNNEIDAGLVSTPLEENHLKEYPLFYEPFVGYFSANEKALEKKLVSPNDISFERIWLLNEGHCMRNQIINLCNEQIEKIQAERPFRFDSSNVDTLRKMVDKHGGLTILPELAILEFDENMLENVRYFEEPEPVREIGLVTTDHFVNHSILDSLSEEIASMAPEKMRAQKKTRKILRIQTAKL
jgi:LysR family hydrogen peroxide-inducible transcriptional activator